VEASGAAVDLARAEWEREARALALAVRERYVEAWEQRQKQLTLDRLLAATVDALRLTEARVAEGDAAPLERQLLLVERNRAEAQRAVFDGHAEAALLELRALVGLEAAAPLELSDWTPAAPPPASGDRPDLRAARVEERQAAAEARLAAAQGHPDVTLSARYSHRNERFDFGTPPPFRDRDNLLTVGVSLPLFTRSRNQGNLEAAGARAAAARLRREQLERAVPLELEAARRRYDAAARAVEIFGSGVLAQSGQNLKVIRQAYELGHLRMLDVLNEQRRLVETELASVDARAEWMRARIGLERAMGGSAQ
jgi:cobalt-zinc-cadmium efflux system outer membrane protein